MCWLHRLLNDVEQVLTQLLQVHFLAQGGAEGCHGLGGIILAAIEAPVNNPLDALAQGLEEGRNRQGGDDDCDIVILVDAAAQEVLQGNDTANIDQG